jgi:Alginate lyase
MIRNARWAVVLAVALLAAVVQGGDKAAPPKVVSSNPAEVAAIKARLAKGTGPLKPALDRVIASADRALQQRPLSVLDRKKSVAGADAHDYVSFAPYFWPHPDKSDGLPYVRKDGKHNDELIRQGDRVNFGAVKQAVYALALGYYFTGDEKYAEHAAPLLRAWFLDPKTRMNPNLDHAQAIPGGVAGRPAGLIEFRDMPQLVDALGLLEPSRAWTEADRTAMRQWLGAYYAWVTTSPIGKGEAQATNNHGTWYDVQVMALALYLGKTDDARRLAEQFGERRIAAQVKPDGSQPRELGRVNSWGYSVFNVSAMLTMAELAEGIGVDVWKYEGPDRQSIRLALDYLTPNLDRGKKWTAGGGKEYPVKPENLAGPLLRAARGLDAPAYAKLAVSLPRSAWEGVPERLLHARP